MSTRAVVSISDPGGTGDTFHIYTHSDGYPEYQVVRIADAIPFAWPLPRFEAMDFAAAFVRGSKEHGGGVYLTPDWKRHGDLEYRYEVSPRVGDAAVLEVIVYRVHGKRSSKEWVGTLDEMKARYVS